MRRSVAPLALLLLSTSASVGNASPRGRPPIARASAVGSSFGTSVGSPTSGHLVGGAHLDDAPYLRTVPVYVAGDSRWGLRPLVAMIDRAARQVRHQFPGAVTSVGHLSRRGGGEIDHHASHESGRDADVAFFVKDARGKEIFADHFVPFRGDGTAATWPGAEFDDAKNWAFVSAIVTDPDARVSHVFVSTPMRARLLAYATRVHAPESTRERAAALLAQPHGALPHDDHFHIRISCPPGQHACVENPPPRRLVSFGKGKTPHKRKRNGAPDHEGDQRVARATPTPSQRARDDRDDGDKREAAARKPADDDETPIFTPEVPGTIAHREREDLTPAVDLAAPREDE